MRKVSDREIALRLTSVYLNNITKLGFKRRLSLDDIVNLYLYILSKLKHKDLEKEKKIKEIILKLEQELKKESKEEILPEVK